jgi:aconitate hydratase
MYDFLNATKRKAIGDFSRTYAKELKEDQGAEYDQLIEINLSELEPHINGPFTPDLATPISKFKDAVKTNNWPEEMKVGLIGSCTNSSYEDMSRAASIARDALDHGVKAKSLFTVTPGSEQIRATIERDGQLQTFEEFGGMVLANACGPCIGMFLIKFKRLHTDCFQVNGTAATSRKEKQILLCLLTTATSLPVMMPTPPPTLSSPRPISLWP